MRLWHKAFIGSLPYKQLLGQYRECCAIAKSIGEDGKPNHVLVNKIADYPIEHFVTYTEMVCDALKEHGYHANKSIFYNYLRIPMNTAQKVSKADLFREWHNFRYLRQCYYNLEEKLDCGGITQVEFDLIDKMYKEFEWGELH